MNLTWVSDITDLSGELTYFRLLAFCIRTVILIVGIFFIWKGLRLTWEIRPIRKKKFTTVVTAKVTELTEEHHSGSMNTYYLPRFIYEIDGEEKAFSPHKAYRPCPLKLDSEVTLCISKKGKFRTIRQNVSAVKAAAFIVSGILLTVSQLNNIPVVISIALTAAGIILLILQELIRKSRSSKNKQKLAS